MTNDEEIRRANEAERLMSTPMLAEAFEKVEKGVVDAMRQSRLGDDKTHTKLVMMLQVVGSIRSHFTEIMETGKLARIQKETFAERALKLVRR